MSNVSIGHTDTFTIQQLDQNGNPLLTPVAYTTPPTWSNNPSAPNVDTFVASPDGTSAVLTADAAGTDSVGVSVQATDGSGNPVTFSASVLVNIQAAPQVFSSIAIVESIS